MFTDNPVTPVRLEILIGLLREISRGLPRQEVYRLLQPEPLDPDTGSSSPAGATVKAAIELELAEEDSGGKNLTLKPAYRKDGPIRAAILKAFDERVLATAEVEKYFALFYAYYLGLGKKTYEFRSFNKEQWADEFNQQVFGSAPQENRFNGTKLTGLHRWFSYVGLGWFDSTNSVGKGEFQANPYERLQRALPAIFGKKPRLEIEPFIAKLAETCPELDGGSLFIQANPGWSAEDRRCTLGLSHALIELHLDGIIRLSCPADSGGWDIRDAEPPGGDNFGSSKIAAIELLKND
jgi:hypothetical protein